MEALYSALRIGAVGLLSLLCLPILALAQPAPLQQYTLDYAIDSGLHNGQEGAAAVVYTAYTHTVRVPDAPWLRLTFSDAELGYNSYLTVRSLQDGAQQHLDARGIAEWYGTSAYFNGDAVEVTLHVAPGDEDVRVRMDEVLVGIDAAPESQCGPTDDRTSSNDARVGRILSVGCTGWLIHDDKVVSAGHCLASGATTLQFNVPASTAGGGLQHPPPEHQYSVDAASRVFVNGGVGNDWGIFRVFDNTQTGLQPAAAQGTTFTLAQDFGPAQIRITGYGVDSGTSNQTQQTHVGPNAGSSGTTMAYQTDTEGGNSGSPVIDEATNRSVGVHTHGGCTTAGTGSNKGTSLFHTAFWDAIGTPPPPVSDACFTIDGQSLAVAFDFDNSTDIFSGVSVDGVFMASGGRGTNGRTLRHHAFTLMSPDADNDPGCGDGNGSVDWLVYNGRVTSGSNPYAWAGYGFNSCSGNLGVRTGTITVGNCPPPRESGPASAGSDLAVPAAGARADADAAGPVSEDAALLSAVPEAGLNYCLTDSFGFTHEGTLDVSSNVLSGIGDAGDAFDWYVQGGRGTAGREKRHHIFTWQNPGAGNDPGCGDGAGNTDWFTYNGLVSGSDPYSYNTVWLNSCGVAGTGSGTLSVGSCPAARPSAPVAGAVSPATAGAATAPAASASAGMEVTGAVALTSSPNPFASSTTISYALAEAGDVRLVVYDLLGREVAVLVDEPQDSGVYSVVFDRGALPSGTYVYRLEAGSHLAVKTMTLVR